jgi:hypothetical protein
MWFDAEGIFFGLIVLEIPAKHITINEGREEVLSIEGEMAVTVGAG